jgi:hypothetical protein
LKSDAELKIETERSNIDLLIILDGNNFGAPWKRPGEENEPYKQGCLTCIGGFRWFLEVEK